MSYKFIARVSDTVHQYPICVSHNNYKDENKDIDDYNSEYQVTLKAYEETANTNFYQSVFDPQQYKLLPDARLLYSPFLSSGVKESSRPDLFTEDEDVKVLIRIGGENGSDYFTPSMACYDLSLKLSGVS